jgi:hypothetical protein
MKAVFISLSAAVAVLPGLLILTTALDIPPNESSVLYGAIVEISGCLTLMIVLINRKKIKKISKRKLSSAGIGLFVLFITGLFTYIFLYGICVVDYPGRSTTFYPLWLGEPLARQVKEAGGREAFLGEYGADQVAMLVHQFSKASLLITRMIFIVAYELVTLPVILAFSILSTRVKADEQ